MQASGVNRTVKFSANEITLSVANDPAGIIIMIVHLFYLFAGLDDKLAINLVK